MKKYTHRLTLMGRVSAVNADEGRFELSCRSGDKFDVWIGRETAVRHLRNLDNFDLDRVPTPEGYDSKDPKQVLKKYINLERLIAVEGILQIDSEKSRFDARIVHVLHAADGTVLFEQTHWWLAQISRMADFWLNGLFGQTMQYDFTKYRTNLGLTGLPLDDERVQECATLSRLIYGLSSAYLLTGCQRYLDAAREGVNYQREQFRSLSHDGKHIIWSFAKRGTELIIASRNEDDYGTIPLYEQIYALAGLAQYYRITLDWEVLEDIRRTVQTFQDCYYDGEFKGYFSHLDYATMTVTDPMLGDNCQRKNWNSIGDHLPAYLINLLLSIDPLPQGELGLQLKECLKSCKQMMQETAGLILKHFDDPNSPFVQERFLRDWKPDASWRWQRNRGIVGHNFKIAWNLMRVAFAAKASRDKQFGKTADQMLALARRLADDMTRLGFDQLRGGVYDALERKPMNSMELDFPWWNTKDFWQQEQAILAYLILYGWTKDASYLDLAREAAAFWNLFFLDRNDGGVYFRVTEDGVPYLLDSYRHKAGHSISGYHAFELNYLAHIYIRTFVTKEPFCLYFRPSERCQSKSINVLPDFLPQDLVNLKRVSVNGVERSSVPEHNFQIEFSQEERGCEFIVEFEVEK